MCDFGGALILSHWQNIATQTHNNYDFLKTAKMLHSYDDNDVFVLCTAHK